MGIIEYATLVKKLLQRRGVAPATLTPSEVAMAQTMLSVDGPGSVQATADLIAESRG